MEHRNSSRPESLESRRQWLVDVLAATLVMTPAALAAEPAEKTADKPAEAPASRQLGGELQGVVQIANLVYAGSKSSKCFSDFFLTEAERTSAISTSRRFHAVKLSSQEMFDFPLVIMTGEGEYELPDAERQMLRKYIERGGFLLASAGCSSPDWDRSFRGEMARIFPDHPLAAIGMNHPIFHTISDITTLGGQHGPVRPLEGLSIGGRMGVLYSVDGLNDTSHSQGCCCCGGNEITNAIAVNVNILAYVVLE